MRAPSLFTVAALLALSAVSRICSAGTTEHDLLEQYLAVACHRERITVQMDFNKKRHPGMSKAVSDMIWRGRVCIGHDRSGECCSQLNMIQEYHIVSSGFVKCGIEKNFFAGGFEFVAKIHYWGVSNVNEVFEAHCAVPFMESHIRAKMLVSRKAIRLASMDFTAQQQNTPPPLSVRLGTNLYVAIEPTIEGMQERLHTYPVRCWSQNAKDDFDVEARRYFIENGCPVIDDSSYLAFLEQKTGTGNYTEWTKMTVPVTQHLVNAKVLNGSAVDVYTEYGRITLMCDVVICTGQKLSGFQNAPMCPRATFCSPSISERRQLPLWMEPFVVRAVPARLANVIKIMLANASEPLDNDTTLSDEVAAQNDENPVASPTESGCTKICPTPAEEVASRRCYPDGFPAYVVVVIAFISFSFGAAFVASLWAIHVKTDPLRKVRCLERSGRGLPLNSNFREPVIRPLNANAFMTTSSYLERQRLVADRPY